ncbi:MAG: sensor histidine kinase [Bacillota bacterium]
MPLRLLYLSRPVVFGIIALYISLREPLPRPLAVAFAAGGLLLVCTSVAIVGWLPVPGHWRPPILWGELLVVAGLNFGAASHVSRGLSELLFGPLATSAFLALDRSWTSTYLAALVGLWVASTGPALVRLTAVEASLHLALFGCFIFFCANAGHSIRGFQDWAERQQEVAVLRERQRIAHEIHDSVAHALTLALVQLQIARRLLARDPAEAASALDRCVELTRSALQDTRYAVRALQPRGQMLPDWEVLSRLAREFGAMSGVQVELLVDPASQQLPPDPVRSANLCRIFQEALTNAHRHGQARRVWARLSVAGSRLVLTVTNDGRPPASLVPGVGMQSIVKRAMALGGTASFQPLPDGLQVTVTIPLPQEVIS